MRAVDVIIRKRDGAKLSREEIASFLRGYLRNEVADYQAAALLMAIFLRGMDFEETAALTDEMMRSGELYDLGGLGLGRTVDKHSTGGVGDKVSLVLAPLVAACGVAVPMVSGRGLGHTGGTLDKLESIPGFQVRLDQERFKRQLCAIGVAMIGQSDAFVPADKRLYALRDVTGTIESIPLICASIMSKKVASGAQALVMDVKVGSGAFMPTLERARELAENLIGVGRALDRPVRALLTDMEQPLGVMIGNSLEVIESIECLRDEGPADLRELTLELAAEMILLAQDKQGQEERREAYEQAQRALRSGQAWEKFREMVKWQGGDVGAVDDPSWLDVSREIREFASPEGGYIAGMDCRALGNAAMVLGAGRLKASDTIDPGVGLKMLVRIGDRVEAGQPLLRIYQRQGRGIEHCCALLSKAFRFSETPVESPALIKERIG